MSTYAFQGTQRITGFNTFPLAYHPDSIGVQRRCIAWAREWQIYYKYRFKYYEGRADFTGRERNVASRVMIDTAAYNSFNPGDEVTVSPLENDLTYAESLSDEKEEEQGQLTP